MNKMNIRYIIILGVSIFLLILFLIALDFRYRPVMNDNLMFDSWTNTVESIDVIYNRSK